MITREKKENDVSDLAVKFRKAKAAFLVDFKGLNVESVTELRKKLRPAQSEMKVVRNTLAIRAISSDEKMHTALKSDFVGNNAVVFAYDDVSESAKILKDFTKTFEFVKLKAGYMDGNRLDESKIGYLSTLPSKDVLRAKLLGTMAAPASQFVRLLNEVPSQFVRVLAAKRDKGA